MSVSERLKRLAKEFGSIEKFSEKCGLKSTSLRSTLARGGELKSDTIGSIVAALPNLNLRWFLLGEGRMWMEEREVGDLGGKGMTEGNEKYLTRFIDLLEKRVKLLERELKESDPELAKKYGID